MEGIVLIGKNEKAAADLSRQVTDHIHMEKWYQTVVCGKLEQREDTLVDYLLKDSRTNTSKVVKEGTPGSKRSELHYEVLASDGEKTLRVQLSHAGLPICGDAKYGKAGGPLCLCAYKVIFSHPRTGKRMEFEVNPTFPVPSTAL